MSNESWCKVASNLDSHPKIRRGGANCREVFLFALRRNAEPNNPSPGTLPAAVLEPWFIADQLMRTESEAAEGLSRAVTVGLLKQNGESWEIVGWGDEWGRGPTTGRERTAKWRKNKSPKRVVTRRDDAVTQSDDVRHGDIEETRGEERRLEEKRREEEEDSDTLSAVGSQPDSSGLRDPNPKRSKPKPSAPSESERASALLILQRLGSRNGISYTGAAEHIRLLVAHLRDGVSELDLRKVIAYCSEHLGWQDDPEMAKYLRPETLFGPKTLAKYLDAARTWFEKSPHARTPTEKAS